MQHTEHWSNKDLSHFFNNTGNDLFDIHHHYSRWLAESRPGGYYLFSLAANSAPSVRIEMTVPGKGEQSLLNLASYNYLGLAQRPEVIEAAAAALYKYGLGAAGSPCLSGQLKVHDELAEAIARFKKQEEALLFPTGYSANIGVISALAKPSDHIITDNYAHASIIDGAVLSRAKLSLFRHNDIDNLERKLRRITAEAKGRVLVIVEGVYSMDGDIAPLEEIAQLCRRYGVRLMVDEAHSAFIYGKNGRGIVEHFNIEEGVDLHLGTLSKSLGGIGGYVAGSKQLIDYLRTYANSQVFSCALTPAVAAGVLAALKLAESEPELRTRLWHNVAIMREALKRNSVDTGESVSQIVPIMINDDYKIFAITQELMEAGIYLNPVMYPAVKCHRSRLRVSISAAHEPEELVESADIIAHVLRRNGVSQ